jgi:hypothetical protein
MYGCPHSKVADSCSASLDTALGILEDPMNASRVDMLGDLELGACQAISNLGEK